MERIERNIQEEVYDLTLYQKDIWMEQLKNPENPCYNLGGYLEIVGDLNLDAFKQAIGYLINENDALRIQIREYNGEFRQIFLREVNYSIPIFDFTSIDKNVEFALDLFKQKMKEPIKDDGLLFDFILVKIKDNVFYWFTKVHHIIGDAWGVYLIHKKTIEIYNSATRF